MTMGAIETMPQLEQLSMTLPLDNAIRLELVEGVPIFRASHRIQARIQALLDKQSESKLTERENQELDLYEEVDDYLSFVNRTVRNSIFAHQTEKV